MSVRMIPSLTEDGDMRFDVFEHPKMTIVGRFFVNPTMDEVSMVVNGAFCTREMVISKQKRSYFAARKDNRSSISEPYSVLLEMMPVARIYTSKIELEHTPFNILIADYCGDVFRAYPVGLGNAGVKIPVFLERENGEIPTALIEKPYTRDTTLQELRSRAVIGRMRRLPSLWHCMTSCSFAPVLPDFTQKAARSRRHRSLRASMTTGFGLLRSIGEQQTIPALVWGLCKESE